MKDFYELFVSELKDMYSSEDQIVHALEELIEAAHEVKLKEALSHHLDETKIQIQRIEEIADELQIDLTNAHCPAMEGILREGRKMLRSDFSPEVKDAAIITAGQRVELYEIAVYGTLKTFAKHLKLKNAQKLLKETLAEEGKADKLLTEIAEGNIFTKGVNKKAKDRESA